MIPSRETRSRIGIIGAGPAGAAAALRLGQLGVPDVALVDRDEFPRDTTCGSGVSFKSIQTLKRLAVWDLVERHAAGFGARLVTSRDRELCLSGGRLWRTALATPLPDRIVALNRPRRSGPQSAG